MRANLEEVQYEGKKLKTILEIILLELMFGLFSFSTHCLLCKNHNFTFHFEI